MITLLQCVKSARWPDDGPLAVFPGVDLAAEKKRVKSGEKPTTLVETTQLQRNALGSVLGKVNVPKPAQDKVLKALDRLPQLQLAVSDVTALGFSVNISRLNASFDREHRIYAPRYPKPQSEGFFVIASDVSNGSILALKRAN